MANQSRTIFFFGALVMREWDREVECFLDLKIGTSEEARINYSKARAFV